MKNTTTIRVGDTHKLTFTVSVGTLVDPVNISGATARLMLRKKHADGTTLILPTTVTDAEGGTITHQLDGTLTVGIYDMEIELTVNGEIITVPSDGAAKLIVENTIDLL